MVGAATFIQSLTTKVDYLSARVTEAEVAWRAYVTAATTYERTAGARPFTSRQSWAASVASWIVPPLALGRAGGWAAFDSAWARQNSNAFATLRSGLRSYEALVTQEGTVQGADLVQGNAIFALKQRGDALKDRGIAVNRLWVQSGAGNLDGQATSDGDAFLRLLVRATPFARWASDLPAVMAGGGGSVTGSSSDAPVPAGQQQGLPPWVLPVAGGILVVSVGYAMWKYSKTH